MTSARQVLAIATAAVAIVLSCGMKAGDVDRESLADVKKIVLLGPLEPNYYFATTQESRDDAMMASLIMGGGILPLMLASGMSESPLERKIEENIAEVQLGAELRNALKARLESEGYEVSFASVRKRKADALLTKYTGVRFPGDAYLDVAIVLTGYNDLYAKAVCPSIYLKARLVTKQTQHEIYETTYEYSCKERGTEYLKVLPVDAKYRFADPKAAADNAELTREGLLAGVPLIADEIAEALKPGAK